MLFASADFIFIFLPIVLFLFYISPKIRLRLWVLFISSLVFYGYWNIKYISLLLFSIFVDYYVGIQLSKEYSKAQKKILLLFSIVTNLGILFFFKYFNFFSENFEIMLTTLGFKNVNSFHLNLILPVGISFYTFQSMSYTIDLYYQKAKPHRDLLAFATYVCLFPQLIAGPIVRHSKLVPQLESYQKLGFNWDYISKGLMIFIIGLAKKILIADRISAAIDPALSDINMISSLEAWLCAIGYTLQLYFDFSGYSDMAIGLGKLFHLDFPINFNSPYKAKSITEFWQKWHISLSTWLRDYLYIPLGGNRSVSFLTYRNLFLTMFLGGLWHGAAWTYVIWGMIHGTVLGLERYYMRSLKIKFQFPNLMKRALTLIVIITAWVFFRSTSVEMSLVWLSKMFSFSGSEMYHFSSNTKDRFFLMLIIGSMISLFSKNISEMELRFTYRNAFWLALICVLSIAYIKAESAFLYFQF